MSVFVQIEEFVLMGFVVGLLAYELFATAVDPEGRFLPTFGF